MEILEKNAIVLRQEFEWLEQCIHARRREYREEDDVSLDNLTPPALLFPDIPYTQFVSRYNLSVEERLTLLLAITSAINPGLLDAFVFQKKDGSICQAPGLKRSQQSGQFMPTGFTVLFLCAGKNEQRRIKCSRLFESNHVFQQKKILTLTGGLPSEPKYSNNLLLTPDWLELFTTGSHSKPVYGEDFPAEEVICSMDWEDMVMAELTSTRLRYMINNVTHGQLLGDSSGLKRLALFHGPAGTGKTTSAAIIGKMCNKPVFKIDTSQVVSKYIGETEKNLARVFDRAEDKGWILFFDEADSLFSKRIENPQSSTDKFVNNEINYVLQRLNDFKETVILGTNLPDTLDKAMGRRQYMKVPFFYPDPFQKLKLWEIKKPKDILYHESVDFDALSMHPNLSPDNIQNVVNFAFIETMVKGQEFITMDLLIEGLKIESEKENKILYDPLKLNKTLKGHSEKPFFFQTTQVEIDLPKEVNSSKSLIFESNTGESVAFDYSTISEEERKELSKNGIIKNWMQKGIPLYCFEDGTFDIKRTLDELNMIQTPEQSNNEKEFMEFHQRREEAFRMHNTKDPDFIVEQKEKQKQKEEKFKMNIENLQRLDTKKL